MMEQKGYIAPLRQRQMPKMRDCVQEAIRSSKYKKAEQTGTVDQKREFVSWKLCKHLLFLCLLFGCHMLARCEPKTMTKVTKNPGFYATHTVTYDGPDDPSIFQGLEKAGYTRAKPNQQPRRLDSILRQLTGRRANSPLVPGRLLGLVSPPKYKRQGSGSSSKSGSGSSPSSDMKNWRKQAQDGLDQMRKTLFSNKRTWGQSEGGMKKKPNLVIDSESDDGHGGGVPAPKKGRNSASPKRNGGRTKGAIQSANTSEADKFAQECLVLHNQYRAKHGVPPLKLNSEMSKVSYSWAKHLANRDSVPGIYHSDEVFRNGWGENIHASKGYGYTCRRAMEDWYGEIKDYDYATYESKNGNQIGHFTQIVWKDSRELGCGHAISPRGAIFIVCHYDPSGNWVGRHPWNVPRVGGFSKADLQKQAEAEEEEEERRRQMIFALM